MGTPERKLRRVKTKIGDIKAARKKKEKIEKGVDEDRRHQGCQEKVVIWFFFFLLKYFRDMKAARRRCSFYFWFVLNFRRHEGYKEKVIFFIFFIFFSKTWRTSRERGLKANSRTPLTSAYTHTHTHAHPHPHILTATPTHPPTHTRTQWYLPGERRQKASSRRRAPLL